jgi:hypothetical protein
VLSAVPERIRHAFLHVRDYAKMHGGSLQIDFIQTISIKPRSVPVVLFLPHHSAPIVVEHPRLGPFGASALRAQFESNFYTHLIITLFFRQMQHNFVFVYVGSRK